MSEKDPKDLLAKAQDFASRDLDIYGLIGFDPATDDATDPKLVHRAWRKSSLKHHPDKAGASFDPAKWEQLEHARDVLLDAAARAAYDNGRAAKARRRAERDRVHGQRKRFIDQLEADELEAKRQRDEEAERRRELEREKARLAEEGRRRLAEREKEEAEWRLREEEERRRRKREEDNDDQDNDDPRLRELQRRLDETRKRKAEKKTRKKGGTVTGEATTAAAANGKPETTAASTTATPNDLPAAPNWDDLKARMIAVQKKRDAAKLSQQQQAEA